MQTDHQDFLDYALNSETKNECEDKMENKPTLKERKAARRARQLVGKNKGRWLAQERRQYYVFLKIYEQFFVSKDHRRNDKVFRMMANFIKSRTPDQCRTHHQKLEFKYFKLSKILQSLKGEFGSIDYEEIVKKCQTASTNVDTPTTTKQRDATFDQCQYGLFFSQNSQNNNVCDFDLKQPSIQSSKKSFDMIVPDVPIFDNGLPSFCILMD